MPEDLIATNISKVLEQVSTAAKKYARELNDIQIMAVSKTRSADAVLAAAAAGLTHFGENYLQEALDKIEALQTHNLTWHFIGPIQSNKTRALAEQFDWVHSVDRAKILRRLSDQRPAQKVPLNICLQVNISGELSKSGVSPEKLGELLSLAASLPGLKLRGLMAIPAPSANFDVQKTACDALAELFHRSRLAHPDMDTLSLGMSADMEAAIASGSTMLRIGTAIFGPRQR
ncbi:MAG: YggS family pyridoxal phosphate-dependent enzyme [Congregibacter sp.]